MAKEMPEPQLMFMALQRVREGKEEYILFCGMFTNAEYLRNAVRERPETIRFTAYDKIFPFFVKDAWETFLYSFEKREKGRRLLALDTSRCSDEDAKKAMLFKKEMEMYFSRMIAMARDNKFEAFLFGYCKKPTSRPTSLRDRMSARNEGVRRFERIREVRSGRSY